MRSDVQEPPRWWDHAVGNLFQEETSLLVGSTWMSLGRDGYLLPATDGSTHGEERVLKGPCTSDGPTGTWKRAWRP